MRTPCPTPRAGATLRMPERSVVPSRGRGRDVPGTSRPAADDRRVGRGVANGGSCRLRTGQHQPQGPRASHAVPRHVLRWTGCIGVARGGICTGVMACSESAAAAPAADRTVCRAIEHAWCFARFHAHAVSAGSPERALQCREESRQSSPSFHCRGGGLGVPVAIVLEAQAEGFGKVGNRVWAYICKGHDLH